MDYSFNSVEIIPDLKAAAAFTVNSSEVFKEDGDITPTIIDTRSNTIREREDLFPEWHASKVAQLYTPTIFHNKKSSGGYWM